MLALLLPSNLQNGHHTGQSFLEYRFCFYYFFLGFFPLQTCPLTPDLLRLSCLFMAPGSGLKYLQIWWFNSAFFFFLQGMIWRRVLFLFGTMPNFYEGKARGMKQKAVFQTVKEKIHTAQNYTVLLTSFSRPLTFLAISLSTKPIYRTRILINTDCGAK